MHGLNLFAPDGRSPLSRINAAWTNIHTWAEVYFPQAGWVEVEPSFGDRAFSIPAQWIRNNKWFQNYAIWVMEDGHRKMPSWTPEDGVYTSEYKVANLITFSEVPEAQ